MSLTSRQWHLERRPSGWPVAADFSFHTVPVPDPAPGQVVVRNSYLSVDPYMRGRMNDRKSYVPPYQLGEVMQGGAVGHVVASAAPRLPVGTPVLSGLGWREAFCADAAEVQPVEEGLAPLPAFLGVLGMPGLTAWVGLYDIGEIRPGETVFISAAAGAVGSLACQLARLAGARVVGSAGGEDKVRYLRDKLGVHAAFDYRAGDPTRSLAEAAPEGVDVYFDNVGGPQLRAAIANMRPHGRLVECGMISSYNEPMPAPDNLVEVVGRKLSMRGFIVSEHAGRTGLFRRQVAGLLARGEIHYPETVVAGIERATEAFENLLRGGTHVGKLIVAV